MKLVKKENYLWINWQLQNNAKNNRKYPGIKAGDMVRVHLKPKLGTKAHSDVGAGPGDVGRHARVVSANIVHHHRCTIEASGGRARVRLRRCWRHHQAHRHGFGGFVLGARVYVWRVNNICNATHADTILPQNPTKRYCTMLQAC